MKKLFITLLASLCATVGLAGLAACGPASGGSGQSGQSAGTSNTGSQNGAQSVDSSHEHTYSDWVIERPSEARSGTATKTCTTCSEGTAGHTVTRTLPPLLNAKKYTVRHVDPTCIDDGGDFYTTTVEGDEITFCFPGEKVGHNYVYTLQKLPTLDSYGELRGVCTVCGEDVEGHTTVFPLPVAGNGIYTVTNNTATCTERGTATYSATIKGVEVTFEEVSYELGHTLVKDTDGKMKCSVCGVKEGTFSANCLGVWYNASESSKLVVEGDSVTLNGEPVEFSPSVTNQITFDGVKYKLRPQLVSAGEKKGYSLLLEGKLVGSNLPVSQTFYGADYPIRAFPEELRGHWQTKGLAGGTPSLDISKKGISVGIGDDIKILSYLETESGFTLSVSRGVKSEGIASDYSEYTIEYNVETGKLTMTNDLASEGASGRTVECTKDTSSGSEGTKLPKYAGTYVAEDGDTIYIDEEGNVTYKGQRVSLMGLNLKEGMVGGDDVKELTFYEFGLMGCAYNLEFKTFDQGYITMICAARLIENKVFTLQQPADE